MALRGGQLLRAWRATQGISQKKFARMLWPRWCQAAISQLEAGMYVPDVDVALQIEEMTSGAVPVTSWRRARRGERGI